MKKLAVVDMMFRWPPDGGARVDIKETVSRLANHFEIVLFAPKVNIIISRGMLDQPVPFQVEAIPFETEEFTGPNVYARFKTALDRFKPDLVFLADGFHMKPWAAMACQGYPYFVKFYAYENFCLRYNGTFMRGDRSCFRTGMNRLWIDKLYCTICGCKAIFTDQMTGDNGFNNEFLGAHAYSPMQWYRTRRMLDHARAIIVYNHLFQDLLHSCGWDSVVIPGGIDTGRFPQQPPRQEDGVIRLGIVGRIKDSYKGVVPAIRALNLLHHFGINAELHLTGVPEDNPRVLPGVVFRGWFSRDRIQEFYESIDICLVPSIWQEPFGIVALEAMCCGRPVIASKVAGLREIVSENRTGLLVAPQSSEDIADAVLKYLRDPSFTSGIVSEAAAMVRDRYGWDRVVDEYYLPLIEKIF